MGQLKVATVATFKAQKVATDTTFKAQKAAGMPAIGRAFGPPQPHDYSPSPPSSPLPLP
jgi:hypothetical protein